MDHLVTLHVCCLMSCRTNYGKILRVLLTKVHNQNSDKCIRLNGNYNEKSHSLNLSDLLSTNEVINGIISEKLFKFSSAFN